MQLATPYTTLATAAATAAMVVPASASDAYVADIISSSAKRPRTRRDGSSSGVSKKARIEAAVEKEATPPVATVVADIAVVAPEAAPVTLEPATTAPEPDSLILSAGHQLSQQVSSSSLF